MALDALVHEIESPTLDGKEEIGARVVGELEVQGIAGDSFTLEPERSCLMLSYDRLILFVDILLPIQFGNCVILEPGVHDEVAPQTLVEEADDRVRVGHLSGITEPDSSPSVARLCLDYELDGVGRLQVFPLRVVGAVALVDSDGFNVLQTVEWPQDVGVAVRVDATLGRIRPAADAPLLRVVAAQKQRLVRGRRTLHFGRVAIDQLTLDRWRRTC